VYESCIVFHKLTACDELPVLTAAAVYEGIIESDDVAALSLEIEKALNYCKKCNLLVESVKRKDTLVCGCFYLLVGQQQSNIYIFVDVTVDVVSVSDFNRGLRVLSLSTGPKAVLGQGCPSQEGIEGYYSWKLE